MPDTEKPRITVLHMLAPVCHWSYGYEPVLRRLRLVYGDQLDFALPLSSPFDAWDEWLAEYGMTHDEAMAWVRDDIAPQIGVPIRTRFTKEEYPSNATRGSLAVVAAARQGEAEGERMVRALYHRVLVLGEDPGKDSVLLAAARDARLDVARFQEAWADQEGLRHDYDHQHVHGPHVPLNFYNIVLWDGGKRVVTIEHAFDPALVEEAIDWLSGGALEKRDPGDLHAYLAAWGPASENELAKVFGVSEPEARARVERLAKEGRAEATVVAGAPHWRAA